MNKIIFGGSFDPIHLGHINMALLASRQFDADVIFVPSPISIWKKTSAPLKDKVEMIKLSIQDYSRFSIDLFEANSGKQENYSIDTVQYFKNKYPEDDLFYLIGADQVNEFHRWKEAKLLSELAHIIFLKRPGFEVDEKNIKEYDIASIEGPIVDISSSEIRSLQKINIADSVITYIEKHELYYIKKIKSFIKGPRYQHSVAVAHLAYEIAKKHHLEDAGQYYIAGILHDIGKETDGGTIMVEHYKEYLDLPPFSYHQFVGAYLASTEFGIKSQDIIDAIKYHATGNEKMTTLGKVIYASDKIDPTRSYDSQFMIDAMMENIETGFILVLKENKKFLESKRKNIDNRLTLNCFNYYLK